jgi:hypothetical protein
MEGEPKLNAKRVNDIFMDCLFTDEELKRCPTGIPENYLMVQGIVNDFGLHPERTESHREEIIELLKELPDEFHKDGGGGWSFMNACDDRHGNQWADEHREMEQLFALGIAIKKAKFQLPKPMWSALPGGMPYVVVDV